MKQFVNHLSLKVTECDSHGILAEILHTKYFGSSPTFFDSFDLIMRLNSILNNLKSSDRSISEQKEARPFLTVK